MRIVQKLLAVIAPLLGVALTLASVFLLLWMTVQSELLEDPIQRHLAILGTMVAGVFLLVGGVYVTTRISVRLFSGKARGQPPEGGNDPR
jgi:heme/copper-type cytochrome/quinol oxidase subunit 2